MKETLQKKSLHIIIPVLIAVLSIFLLSGFASSADFHKGTLAALEEKQTTVLELSAASATASAAITLIPGDVATPIADKLADLSSHFLLVLCAIFLEKYLLTITGSITFSLLIPVACALYVVYILFDWESLRLLASKLVIFGLLIFLLIPASVKLSNMIEGTYQASIEATIETATSTAEEIESTTNTTSESEEGFWSGLVSSVTEGVSNAALPLFFHRNCSGNPRAEREPGSSYLHYHGTVMLFIHDQYRGAVRHSKRLQPDLRRSPKSYIHNPISLPLLSVTQHHTPAPPFLRKYILNDNNYHLCLDYTSILHSCQLLSDIR